MKTLSMLVGFLVCSTTTTTTTLYGQSVIRSTISSYGGSYSSDGITVQHTTGQPYQTRSYYDSPMEARPGFIQPTQLMVELIRSTFTVDLNVYPNPAASSIAFKLEEDIEDATINVIDLSGNSIYEEAIPSLRGYQLDCSSWSNGTYMIFLKDKEGNTYQSKLIKN